MEVRGEKHRALTLEVYSLKGVPLSPVQQGQDVSEPIVCKALILNLAEPINRLTKIGDI